MIGWVGWHLQIHDPVFHCIGISKLQETQIFKRGRETVPGPRNQSWSPLPQKANILKATQLNSDLFSAAALWSTQNAFGPPYHSNQFLGLGYCGCVEQFSLTNPTIDNWRSILRHQVQRGQSQTMKIPFLLSEGLKLAAET